MTTDTASEVEEVSRSAAKAENEEEAAPVIEEGIKSSDEEVEVAAPVDPESPDAPAEDQQFSSFEKRSLYRGEQEKDKVQHKYGYSEIDLEEYAAKIETRQD